MADLDDFFAKKDRKKSKTKKFATPEELAKSIEEAAKKTAESKARKVTPQNPEGVGNEPKKPAQADEEWKEFEEERKDYSGLKLAQLTISEQEGSEDTAGKDGGSAVDGDGEGGDVGSGNNKSGAWRNVDSSAESADKQQQLQQQQQQRAGPSVYVTPAMKNLRLKKKGVAPDLKNEEFFPTLGAEAPVDPTRGKKDSTFEEVKHGGRVRSSDLPSAQPLQVGNRFTSLSNDAS
ncbi:protein CDV3 homolog [Armigeres subalbatus]|uniref:protein CDV3 homolog n=1 Tax=Armigeres subalbatus TaxID=124917 RepID=UPI002ED39B85